jgi:D-glycero-D-manno-heptose 1,7-bisphosphate phosphatase
MTPLRPAVFLDRDGTLNVEQAYITRPDQIRLLPGVAAAIAELQRAGFVCVVVTNQSAVGRGMMSVADLDVVHAELNRQLFEQAVTLDGIYACPHCEDHPDRKPAPGMLLRAAAELGLDLAQSWMVGDSLRDVRAGQAAGCRGCVLVRSGHPIDDSVAATDVCVVDDLAAAVQVIVGK